MTRTIVRPPGSSVAANALRIVRCDSCGSPSHKMERSSIEGHVVISCVDFMGCADRTRMGMTPEVYQRYLKAVEALSR